MPQFLVLLIVFVAVMVGGMYGFSMLASKMVTHAVQGRLRALQQITEGRVPDVWLRPFQRKVTALHQAAANDARFSRLGERIQKYCLSHLDEMIRYTAKVNFTDSETTHKEIIGLLKAYQQAWPAKGWREWIAAVETLDIPATTEVDQTDFPSAD